MPLLVAADLPPGRGPLPVVPDHGGAGPLGGDEQDVREVLARHERGQAQPRGPVAGGAQRLGVLVQAGAERGQLLQVLVLPGQVRGRRDAGSSLASRRPGGTGPGLVSGQPGGEGRVAAVDRVRGGGGPAWCLAGCGR